MSTSSLPEPPFPAPDAYCDIAEDEAVKAVKAGRAKHEEEVVEWEDDQEQEHKSRSTDFGHACGHGHRNEHGQIWEKVLWRRQPFPDNYVPSDFLSELKRLPPRPTPGVLPLFFAALPISLHLSTIAIFLSIFYNLLHEIMSPEQVGFGCVIFGMGGWGIYKLGWGLAEYRKNATDRGPIIPAPTPLRSVILPPLLLSLLSPVLGTLTSATTSDSIWPLAAGLGLVHLLLADFRTGEDLRLRRRRDRARRLNAEVDSAQRQDAAVFSSPTVTLTGAESKGKGRSRRGSVVLHEIEQEKSLTSSLSLTSALSASVVLASRLPSTAHVFSLILLAVLLFAGWPRVAKGVREAGRFFSLVLTVSTAMLSISLFPALPSSTLRLPLPFLPPLTMRTHTGTDAEIDTEHVRHAAEPQLLPIPLPTTPTTFFLTALLVVNVIGPGLLIYAWRWKNRRGGGWDVAVVRVRKGRAPGG